MRNRGITQTWQRFLRYAPTKASQATIRRLYQRYRIEARLPERCDNAECSFHTKPPTWNGKRLPLTLDHINGVRYDNRPKNLRLLCPNCDAQLATRGGGNVGRLGLLTSGGYATKDKDGKLHHRLIVEPGEYSITWGRPQR
jgi:hypothetical protein